MKEVFQMTQKIPDVRRPLPMGTFDYHDRFTEELDTMKIETTK